MHTEALQKITKIELLIGLLYDVMFLVVSLISSLPLVMSVCLAHKLVSMLDIRLFLSAVLRHT